MPENKIEEKTDENTNEKVIQYILEKIKTAKAVFIMGNDGKWEFYGNIPKPYDMPKEVTEPLVHIDPDNPDAWWNPLELYNILEDGLDEPRV